MTIVHHPADDLIVGYAAGSLTEAYNLVVATHLALCPRCRGRLRLAESVGGALLDDRPAAGSQDEASWVAVRARLARPDGAGPPRSASPPMGASAPVLPQPLRDYVGGDLDAIRWRALGRGAYQFQIAAGEQQVRLLRIPAGKPVPEHGHRGTELTLVLSGSFRDGDLLFGRGDLEEADDSLVHQPIATPGQDCICLAVTDAPLRFSSRLLRLIQPLLGI